MELKQLRYFIAVCTYHSMSKSAEALFISQQALSKVIANFEKEIGVQLFTRRAHSVEMTAYAEELLPLAKKVIRSTGEVEQLIAEMTTGRASVIKFGYLEGTFHNHSMISLQFLKAMEAALQNIKLQVKVYNPDEIMQMLKDGEIDIAYNVICLDDEDIAVKVLTKEPARIVLSQNNPLAKHPTVTFEDLRELPILSPTDVPMDLVYLENSFQKAGYLPKVKPYVGKFPQIMEWIRLDEGYFVTGSKFCESINQEGLAILPFPDEDVYFTHCILYNKRRISPPLRRVLRYIDQHCVTP